MGSIYKLIIEDDEGKTTVVPVTRGEISIGRMEGNTIRLMERNVSRRHARLLRENGVIFIEDLNSFNGVKINGERIDQRIEIKEGDLVEIGDYHLALQAAEHEDEDKPTARPEAAKHDVATGGAHWPQQAGTVPDLRLPEEILAEAKAQAAQDARNDKRFDGQDPLVSPPPRGSRGASPALPPFPSPGGAPAPMFPGAGVEEGGLRTEPIKVGPARVADVPRIICVSTEYAGREFALTRPEVIVGRVEDNDIVIEHRSVSRNHAKILFDGRVHKIIDLESANGILVNGEEYAITDLRKGDLIELGHVRFRFVPAGESFAPNDEEVKAMLEAGVTPPPRAQDPQIAAPAKPEPAAAPAKVESAPSAPALVAPAAPNGANGHAHGPDHRIGPADADAMLGQGATVEIPGMDVSDSSNAATVTDTPISALNLPSHIFEPKVEPVAAQAGGATSGRSEPASSKKHAMAHASTLSDEAPATEVGPAAKPSSVRAGGSAAESYSSRRATQVNDDDDVQQPRPSGAGKTAVALAIVVLIVVGLGLAGMKFFGGGEPYADDELKTAFESGKYADVERIYLEKDGRFKDKKEALRLVVEAKARVREKPEAPAAAPAPSPPTPSPAPAPKEEPPEGDAPAEEAAAPGGTAAAAPTAARPTPAREPPPGELDEEKPQKRPVEAAIAAAPAPAPAPAAAAKAPAPAPAPAVSVKKKEAKAKEYELQGRQALLAGDLVRAERALKSCLSTYEYADCHRQLGVLYAQQDDRHRALYHYKRYVELKPDAADAAKVRAVIREAGGD